MSSDRRATDTEKRKCPTVELDLCRSARPGFKISRRGDAACGDATGQAAAGGVSLSWSGQFKYLERASAKLKIVLPFTLAIIFVLLYMTFSRVCDALLIMGKLPFALIGGVGSEVMQRIAAAMVGGMISAPLLSMLVIPALYKLLHRRG